MVGERERPEAGAGVRLRIEGLAGARGVGRHEGVVWLVEGGLPGDLVEARPTRRLRRHVEGYAGRILEPAASRRPAPCPVQGRCGGCPWMPLPEDEQRDWKRRALADALRRLGGIAEPPVDPIEAVSPAFGYRQKVEFTLERHEGRLRAGLQRAGGGWLAVDGCPLLAPAGAEIFDEVVRRLGEAPEDARAERLALRVTANERVLAALQGRGPAPAWARRFAAELAGSCPAVLGVVWIDRPPGRRGAARTTRLHGRSRYLERIGELRFEIPVASFAQVNSAAAARLVAAVGEAVGNVDGSRIWDLYAGVGTTAITLARAGAAVVACEADAEAAAALARNARSAGVAERVELRRGSVSSMLAAAAGPAPATIVANPPRSGFERAVAAPLAAAGARRIVVVSCEPATLARDAGPLIAAGYRLVRVQPFDLFPQTPHVESVALFEL